MHDQERIMWEVDGDLALGIGDLVGESVLDSRTGATGSLLILLSHMN
jgi:hypothetical protein